MNGPMKLLNELGSRSRGWTTIYRYMRFGEGPEPQTAANDKRQANWQRFFFLFLFYHANSALFRISDRQRQSGALVHLSETICTYPMLSPSQNHPSIECHFPFSVAFHGLQVARPLGTRATFDFAQLRSICAVFGIFYSLFNEPVYCHFVDCLAPKFGRSGSQPNCFATYVWCSRLDGLSTAPYW